MIDGFVFFVCMAFLFIHFRMWLAIEKISDTLEEKSKNESSKHKK